MCCHTRFSPSLFSKYDDGDDGNDDDEDEVHGDDDDVINVPQNRNPLVMLTVTLRRCVRIPAHKYHRPGNPSNFLERAEQSKSQTYK